jgi:peptidyl-prolyl cis-trans isomerase SurA
MNRFLYQILFLFLFFASAFSAPIIVDRIVAIVGKEPILQSEVFDLIRDSKEINLTPKQALDTLIADQVISQEIKKLGLEVTLDEIEQTVKSVMKQYNLDQVGFLNALNHQGLSLEAYREQLKKQLCRMKIIQAKIKHRVKISDDDIKSAYQKQYPSDNEFKVHLHYMLFKNRSIASREKAKAIFSQLKSGKEFFSLGRNLSTDKNVVLGDFGEVKKGDLLAEFEKHAFNLPELGFSSPIESDNGYFVIFVSKRIPVEKIPLEKVEKDLHKQLYEKEIEREFEQYIGELKVSAYIEERL